MPKSKIPTKKKSATTPSSPGVGEPKPRQDDLSEDIPTVLYKHQDRNNINPTEIPEIQIGPIPKKAGTLNKPYFRRDSNNSPARYQQQQQQLNEASEKRRRLKKRTELCKDDDAAADPDVLILHQSGIASENNVNSNPTAAGLGGAITRSSVARTNLGESNKPPVLDINSGELWNGHAMLQDITDDALLPVSQFSSRLAMNCPISWLSDKPLKKIFSYLHPSDLAICRTVEKYWNALICQDEYFLENTVFVVNMVKTFNEATQVVQHSDVTSSTWLPFRHTRFQYIDSRYLKEPEKFNYRNSDNEKYFPCAKFLQSLTSIEFKCCFLLWKTIKSLLVQAVQVVSLKISNCHISNYSPASSTAINEFDEFNAGNAVFGLKSLEVYETVSLVNITAILKKFSGYMNQGLTTLKIIYHPPATHTGTGNGDEDRTIALDFCREVKTVISLCANSLNVLVLDIQHEITLDLVGYHVSKELAALGGRMDLQEFQLSPGLDCWMQKPSLIPTSNVVMSLRTFDKNTRELQNCMKIAASSLVQFLQLQKNLEVLGLPYMEYPETSSFFKMIMGKLKCAASLKFLAVPSAGFLPKDLFKYFPNLKGVKVGTFCCNETTPGWNLFRHYTKTILEQKRLALTSIPEAESTAAAAVAEESNANNTTSSSSNKVQFSMAKIKTESDLVALVPGISFMKKMEHISISSAMPPEPDNFGTTVRFLGKVNNLEINSGYGAPVLNDEDLQICIKHLRLQSLVIACANKLTDYGLTGISPTICRRMFTNQKYHKEGVRSEIWTSDIVTGRPLSDMKGLRKLVLMGNSEVTDIGIGYGLKFTELKYCHLPYSDNITEWGIETLGENNPSLESLAFSGVNQYTKEAFQKLRKSHPRLKRGDTTRCGYFEERTSPFHDTLATAFPTNDEIKEGFLSVFRLIRNVGAFLIRPITMEIGIGN